MPPLTIENSSALVMGGGESSSKETSMQPKQSAHVTFEVTSAFYFQGEVQEVGSKPTLPRSFAVEMQSANKGKIVPDATPVAETATAASQSASSEKPEGNAAKEKKKP